MSSNPISLTWSSQFSVAPPSRASSIPGDKILLPPSTLEQLLAAAPVVATESSSGPHTTTFDPFNPSTYTAERQARAQFQDSQQQLPHPRTFRVVNPQNGRVVYAGIREFSAEEGEVVVSKFLRESLGLEDSEGHMTPKSTGGNSGDHDEVTVNGVEQLAVNGNSVQKLTIH